MFDSSKSISSDSDYNNSNNRFINLNAPDSPLKSPTHHANNSYLFINQFNKREHFSNEMEGYCEIRKMEKSDTKTRLDYLSNLSAVSNEPTTKNNLEYLNILNALNEASLKNYQFQPTSSYHFNMPQETHSEVALKNSDFLCKKA